MLAKTGARTLAYVADEDTPIHTIDWDSNAVLATTPLGGRPGGLLVLSDGRLIAALKDQSRLEVLEPGDDSAAPLAERCFVETPTEPSRSRAHRMGRRWSSRVVGAAALTGFRVDGFQRRFTADLA